MAYVKFFMNKIVRDNIDWSREPGIFSEIIDLIFYFNVIYLL